MDIPMSEQLSVHGNQDVEMEDDDTKILAPRSPRTVGAEEKDGSEKLGADRIDSFFRHLKEEEDFSYQGPPNGDEKKPKCRGEIESQEKRAKNAAARREEEKKKNFELCVKHMVNQMRDPTSKIDGVYIILINQYTTRARGWSPENTHLRRLSARAAHHKTQVEMELGVPQDSGERADEVNAEIARRIAQDEAKQKAKNAARNRRRRNKKMRVRAEEQARQSLQNADGVLAMNSDPGTGEPDHQASPRHSDVATPAEMS